jgi:4-hydroxy-3-methylbut-2-enyl diphosphate reductase
MQHSMYGDISAFMPHSLSGLSREEDPEILVGKKTKVKINDLKEKRNEIELVVSRKEIANDEKQIKIRNFIEKVKCGDLYRGKVKATINVGAFVSIEDVDIFVPISEISWRRINSPSDVLKENQIVDVLIIKVDAENRKVTGSIKRIGEEPFEKFVME